MKIITNVVNRPGFIEIQYKMLKKHFKINYEFIVFNDAKSFSDITNGGNTLIKNEIEKVCSFYDIKCINVPNDHHASIKNIDSSVRHADTLNFILKYMLYNHSKEKYLILDSDMFLIHDFYGFPDHITSAVYLQNRIIDNNRIYYIWPGICYFNMQIENSKFDLLDFSVSGGLDTGGMTKNWLYEITNKYNDIYENNQNKILFIEQSNEFPPSHITDEKILSFLKNDSRNKNGKMFCEIFANSFLHYRNGSCWDSNPKNAFLLNANFNEHLNLYKNLKYIFDL
jgi:hypothetical protein